MPIKPIKTTLTCCKCQKRVVRTKNTTWRYSHNTNRWYCGKCVYALRNSIFKGE